MASAATDSGRQCDFLLLVYQRVTTDVLSLLAELRVNTRDFRPPRVHEVA